MLGFLSGLILTISIKLFFQFYLFRYKHHCGSNGQWDIIPGEKTCVQCPKPELQMPNWIWDCYSSRQHVVGSKCFGICKFDNNTQLSIKCQKNSEWNMADIARGNFFQEHFFQ